MNYISPNNSKLLAGQKPIVVADGTRSAIKIRLRDHKNRPVSGRQVELYSDSAAVQLTQPALTDDDGLCVGYAAANTPGNVLVYARVLPNCIETADLLLSELNEILLVEPQDESGIIGLKLETSD